MYIIILKYKNIVYLIVKITFESRIRQFVLIRNGEKCIGVKSNQDNKQYTPSFDGVTPATQLLRLGI